MPQVVGRYAPSPTGPLHFGSLLAAVASFCNARAQGGAWELRIDDLDPQRMQPGAAEHILETLAAYGLRHDGPVVYQSTRGAAYAAALATLRERCLCFDCGCTRREARRGVRGIEGPVYPGTCRDGLPAGRLARSVRFRVELGPVGVDDCVQGRHVQDLARDIGDFIIRRADGITAYQLATVVDDAAAAVTEVVRGADLLPSTPRQTALQQALNMPTPRYAHVPVVVDGHGDKLSKSQGALSLDAGRRTAELVECLQLLGQRPPPGLCGRSVRGVLRWAVDNWSLAAVPRRETIRRLESPGAPGSVSSSSTSDDGPTAPDSPSGAS